MRTIYHCTISTLTNPLVDFVQAYISFRWWNPQIGTFSSVLFCMCNQSAENGTFIYIRLPGLILIKGKSLINRNVKQSSIFNHLWVILNKTRETLSTVSFLVLATKEDQKLHKWSEGWHFQTADRGRHQVFFTEVEQNPNKDHGEAQLSHQRRCGAERLACFEEKKLAGATVPSAL